AADTASTLESEAVLSNDEQCPGGPPCRAFSDRQRNLQSRGKSFETAAHLALGFGIATTAAAGAMWYWEYKANRGEQRRVQSAAGGNKPATGKKSKDITAMPVVTDDYIGAAASWRF